MPSLISSLLVASMAASSALVSAAPQGQSFIPSPPGLESDAEIAAMCQTPKTLWERHLCSTIGNVQQGCTPQRRFANSNKNATNIKGAVLLFHGYTACPDAMQFAAEALQNAGFLTYTPLNPGHGMKLGDCSRPGAICLRDTPVDKLPTKKDQYIDFVKWSIDMMKEELKNVPQSARSKDFVVGVTGLSLGGPLATAATAFGNDLFNKTILINPFYAINAPFLDFPVADCQASSKPQECINKLIDNFIDLDKRADAGEAVQGVFGFGRVLKWLEDKARFVASFILDRVIGNLLLNRYMSLMRFLASSMVNIEAAGFVNERLDFLDSSFGWGDGCFQNTARPGYCIFQIRNLVALSAFGTYSLSRTQFSDNKNIAIITTERDGYVRNGIAYSAASAFAAKGNAVSFCMFNRGPGCSNMDLIAVNNTCGMPHSAFSRSENIYTAPFEMYWEKDTFANMIDFFLGTKKTIGTPGNSDKAVCENLELGSLLKYKNRIADASAIVEDSIERWDK